MVFDLRLGKSLFFIIFVFISTVSAQEVSSIDNSTDRSAAGLSAPGEPIEKSSPLTKENKKLSIKKKSLRNEAAGQTDAANKYLLTRGTKEIQLEYGISPFNPSNFAGPKEFDVYGRHLHLFNVRFARVIGTKKNVSYQYMFGATPLAIFTKNEVVNPDFVSATATPNRAPTKRETTYGTGFQPVNFKFIFLARNCLKPYAQVGAGIMVTNKAVPVPRSTLFQLTGDFGGGLMYMLSERRAVNFGYKYFHISNGNINGKINNPGFNANVFSVSYSFFWK